MSVRVVARIRPLLQQELDKDIIVHAASKEEGRPNTLVRIPSPKNEAEEFTFAFNSVYDQGTTQDELFSAEGTRLSVSSSRQMLSLNSELLQSRPISNLSSKVLT
jgi:hypothetical protein